VLNERSWGDLDLTLSSVSTNQFSDVGEPISGFFFNPSTLFVSHLVHTFELTELFKASH
jgi:hypothetical protein